MLFNQDTYRIMKKTLHHFQCVTKEESVGIEEFIQQLDRYFEESVMDKSDGVVAKYRMIKLRLESCALRSDQYNQLDIGYFSHMIDLLKNKQYEEGMDAKHMRLQKIKSLQIFFARFDSVLRS